MGNQFWRFRNPFDMERQFESRLSWPMSSTIIHRSGRRRRRWRGWLNVLRFGPDAFANLYHRSMWNMSNVDGLVVHNCTIEPTCRLQWQLPSSGLKQIGGGVRPVCATNWDVGCDRRLWQLYLWRTSMLLWPVSKLHSYIIHTLAHTSWIGNPIPNLTLSNFTCTIGFIYGKDWY